MSDEDREALARAFANHVAGRRGLEPLSGRAWAVTRTAWESDMEPLLPVVDAIARRRAADELRRAAEESTYWVMTRETVYTRLNEHADALEAGR